MTTCTDHNATRELPDFGAIDPSPPPPEFPDGLLVRRLHELKAIARTAHEEVDVHTAVTRALAKYLETLEGQHAGRLVRLVRVVEDYPTEWTEGGDYPAAGVWSTEDGVFGGNLGTGVLGQPVDDGNPDPDVVTYLQPRGEFTTSITVRVYCGADKELRIGVRRLLDQAFTPVDWIGGFKLRLPFYFNAVADYGVTRAQMLEGAELGLGDHRIVQYTLSARAPWLRLFRQPRAKIIKSPGAIVPAGTLSQ